MIGPKRESAVKHAYKARTYATHGAYKVRRADRRPLRRSYIRARQGGKAGVA